MPGAHQALQGTPPATLMIIVLCAILYLLQILTAGFDLHQVTLCPRLVLGLNEYYRIISSALFHGSFMHIGMNMLSTAAIATMLEKRFGTLRLIVTIMWSILLTAVVYILIAIGFALFLGSDDLMYQHSIGFSGVIFHLSVLESNLGAHLPRSVFGFFQVPSYLYPWVLLVVLQFIMPGLSFTGHLAGIITGTLQLYGVLDVIMVDDNYLKGMESWGPPVQWLVSLPNFVSTQVNQESSARDPRTLGEAVCRGAKIVLTYVWYVLEAIKVIVFGRGREANANIQLFGATGGALPTDNFDDDEDWAGLPHVPEQQRTTSTLV